MPRPNERPTAGTFTYDAQEPGPTPWHRLVPIGLMWGNDPARLFNGQPLVETWINPNLRMPQHLGYGMGGQRRLNGPVDNPISSCLSCHSTAAISLNPPRPTIRAVPQNNPTNQELALYFRNIQSGVPFSTGYTSLDYSRQLQDGIANLVNAGVPAPAQPVVHGIMSSATATRRRAADLIKPMERDGTPGPEPRPVRPARRRLRRR